MNKWKLREVMSEYHDTYSELGKAIGVTERTIVSKMNGDSEFTQSEIAKIIERYKMTSELALAIFFS